ncbi:MAG: 3'(2'),5'-bisphosphate nucleotidase CysQ [Chromatiales bacterium]|jgi:3'(2'), 5'-bisphosphate nucleotidase|nr:MAG: 3'(2'),5'-bisphosphate nucleotidase CysQ [Chromatiales bacterium]
MKTSLQDLLPGVLDVARAAGRAISGIYARSDLGVEIKADQSPLTAADRAAHDVIAAGLARLAPGIPVWSEESAGIDWSTRRQWQEFWLVDPLDGTKEFIKRNGEFTVNIALVREHKSVLGVVHAPVLARDYCGHESGGAFRSDGGGTGRSIRVRQPALPPVRVAGSRSHRGGSLDDVLGRLGDHTFLSMGSSLKFCLVAEGAADFYPRLGPTSEWDTAAAQAVVEAAGGAVLDLEGRPLRYNTRHEVLNPFFVARGDPGRDWLALVRG